MKKHPTRYVALLALALAAPVYAGDTLDAAIGGGLGGAAGAAIGNEVGGRKGAIVGGAVGGAVGTAITTDGNDHHDHDRYDGRRVRYDDDYYDGGHRHRGHFCPPGQAKKGNC
ncbi:MAG: glycine zipper domain-containing protein [Immundisolibacter sp.]|uniref:YMGG-like glycine zipper-containing protein n=1 Tax=Immundisolibacter sp. TaxID=1934948 RepID=UPI003D0FE23E